MKKTVSMLMVLFMMLSLVSCSTPTVSPETLEPEPVTVPEPELPEPVKKTAVQSQTVTYIPISQVGTYNPEIITDELLNGCTLPTLNKAALPYWTGYILENKASVNCRESAEWDQYTGGPNYFNEQEIRYLVQNDFNCVRVLYSLSYLSNPEDVYSINVSELEQLDELISWCLKYNIHLILSQTGLPGKWVTWGEHWQNDFEAWDNVENVVNNTELFTSVEMQQVFTAYWDMLAKRYQNIPNSVLSFELAVEQGVPDANMQLQADVLGPVAQTIWSHNADRIVIVNDVWKQVPALLAKLGCCISLHTHINSLDDGYMPSNLNLTYQSHWPMQYLPYNIDQSSGSMRLVSESTFNAGTLKIYYNYYNVLPRVLADGVVIYEPNTDGCC